MKWTTLVLEWQWENDGLLEWRSWIITIVIWIYSCPQLYKLQHIFQLCSCYPCSLSLAIVGQLPTQKSHSTKLWLFWFIQKFDNDIYIVKERFTWWVNHCCMSYLKKLLLIYIQIIMPLTGRRPYLIILVSNISPHASVSSENQMSTVAVETIATPEFIIFREKYLGAELLLRLCYRNDSKCLI